MQQEVSKSRSAPVDAASARRYQAIIMIVGIAIIVSGLWFVYEGDAPYHPDDGANAEVTEPRTGDS